jgi:hypothetical protein
VKIRYKLAQADRTESPKRAADGAGVQTAPPSSLLQFRLIADNADTNSPVDVMIESQGGRQPRRLRVLRPVLMDGSAVAHAGIQLETNGTRTIGIELTAEGGRRFESITASNIGRRIAIVAGGRVLSAPMIRSAVPGGELQITGNLSAAEADNLVTELNRMAATNGAIHASADGTRPTTNSIGWLRGTWIYDKEYSAQKTAELRAITTPPQKSIQDIVGGAQKSVETNKGMPDVAKLTGEMTAATAGIITTMKDALAIQFALDLLHGTQMTFDETEVRTFSRLSPPATMKYETIKVISPTAMEVHYATNGGAFFFREGERFRLDYKDPNPFAAFYFKRLQATNHTPEQKP